jgi:hypothetical protein
VSHLAAIAAGRNGSVGVGGGQVYGGVLVTCVGAVLVRLWGGGRVGSLLGWVCF